MAQPILPRSAVAREYTWDPSSVFETDEAWAREIERVDALLPGLAAYRGRLAESPQLLADYLQAAEQVISSAGKIGVYATMFYAVDTADQAAVAKRDRAQGLSARAGAAMAFTEPELLAIGTPVRSQRSRMDA